MVGKDKGPDPVVPKILKGKVVNRSRARSVLVGYPKPKKPTSVWCDVKITTNHVRVTPVYKFTPRVSPEPLRFDHAGVGALRAPTVMSTEEGQREYQRFLELYGDPDDDEGLIAKRDAALADLFHRSGWTQTRWAEHLGKSQGWVQKRLQFGRFLSYLENNPTGLMPDGLALTERRFRSHWGQTGRDDDEAARFAEVVRRIAAPPALKPLPTPRAAPAAAVEEPTVAEPEFDVSSLSLTAQQKFAALERRLRREMEAELEARVQQRVTEWLQSYVVDKLGEKLRKAELLMQRGKPFTNKEFTSILLRSVHPDSSSPENRVEAFRLLKDKEILLRPEEKDRPFTSGLPQTVAELLAQRKARKS